MYDPDPEEEADVLLCLKSLISYIKEMDRTGEFNIRVFNRLSKPMEIDDIEYMSVSDTFNYSEVGGPLAEIVETINNALPPGVTMRNLLEYNDNGGMSLEHFLRTGVSLNDDEFDELIGVINNNLNDNRFLRLICQGWI